MADFDDLQQEFQTARALRDQAAEARFAARERLRRIEQELASLERIRGDADIQFLERKKEVERQRAVTLEAITRSEAEWGRVARLAEQRWEDLRPFTDPRANVHRLSEQIPFLLFPVRLETRFGQGRDANGNARGELWVRVFPDDCLIDTFEPLLSEAEVKSARTFWTEMWKAGGVESQQRGAWQGLVQAHGSGRAAWIYQQHKPLNLADQPAKSDAAVVMLVVQLLRATADIPYTTEQQAAAFVFWEAVWRANGAAAPIATATAQLRIAVGQAKADEMMSDFRPVNLGDPSPAGVTRAAATVRVAVLVLPPAEAVEARRHGWSRAPKPRLLPDRFVLLGYRGDEVEVEVLGEPVPGDLAVGPDPSATDDPGVRQEGDALAVGPRLRWMTDFTEAVRVGLGFRVVLTPDQATRGFDRLMVLGVRLSADGEQSRREVEQLLHHHQYSSTGFGLVPQGAATNNTESDNAAFRRIDDPDESYDLVFGKRAVPPPTPDPALKRDGQWLAEWLGLDPTTFSSTLYADGVDQSEARAMNAALWPATLGFLMDSMMQEVYPDGVSQATRDFFTRFVQGRGPVPALRVGRQPYGVLPTAAFSRLRWQVADRLPGLGTAGTTFLQRLYDVLVVMNADWNRLIPRADWVGKRTDESGRPVDPHQTLLNIVGLHPASVEYHQRLTPGRDFLWNLLQLGRATVVPPSADGPRTGLPETPEMATGLDAEGMELLQVLGYPGPDKPDILDKVFQRRASLLQGPVVDDRPLSETEPIRSYTPPLPPQFPQGQNYLQWLATAATNPEALRKQEGFVDGKPPTALLYLLLRRALEEGYHDMGLRLYAMAGVATPAALRQARRDAPFIHIQDPVPGVRESKYEWLYAREPRIGNGLVVEQVAGRLRAAAPEARDLSVQLAALQRLQDTPTARLERLFAEHIDCCSYRLDAWKTGLIHWQLATMRRTVGPGAQPVTGIHLGAFGWLEEVRPEGKALTPVRLAADLTRDFQKQGAAPLVRDDTNQGYIFAPSLNQAVTAAVLRNGYLSNATPDNPDTLAVNLSSERVRLALSVIEGIRNGQSLGALLGYQLERGLHDRYDDLRDFSVDDVIFDLRLAFPLAGGQLASSPEDDSREAVEARNVINGLDLVNHIRKAGKANYPFGLPDRLPDVPDADRRGAIDEEVDRIRNIHDAVADVAMTETVYQVMLGNYERAGATLDAYGRGNFPPEPEVVQTPRSGIALTHRVGLLLDPAAAPPVQPTPRARAEPALNAWLATRLPDLTLIGTRASWLRADGTVNATFVTAAQLGLQPIDLLFLAAPTDEKAMTELDDRVEHFARRQPGTRQESSVSIAYTETDPAGRVTFFELAPLLDALRALALQSRPLRPSDLALPEESAKTIDQQPGFPDSRADTIRGFLTTDFTSFRTAIGLLTAPVQAHYSAADALERQIADPGPGDDVDALKAQLAGKQHDIIQALDALLGGLIPVFLEAGMYRVGAPGTGGLYEKRRQILSAMHTALADCAERWAGKLKHYDDLIAEFDTVKGNMTVAEAEKVRLLRRADAELSASPATGESVAALEGPVKARRAPFVSKSDALKTLLDAAPSGLAEQRQTIRAFESAAPAATTFDLQGIDLTPAEKQMLTFGRDLLQQAATLVTDLDSAVATSPSGKAAAKLAAHDATVDPAEKLKALDEAAQLLFGEDFHLVPTHAMPAKLAAEWQNAWNGSPDLLRFQHDQLGNDFPEDDWLHGVARVRPKITHWETMTLLSEPLGMAEPALRPTQLPVDPNARWLALQFRKPEESEADFASPTADHLLFTAHPPPGFDPTRLCGLLIDEWTEVLPAKEETTGLTFHFDRPNSEAPQAWLLVTPAVVGKGWQWNDLTDALTETLEAAKQRAVEPAFIDDTPYARFLPATMATATTYPITIALDYALNNQHYLLLSAPSGGG